MADARPPPLQFVVERANTVEREFDVILPLPKPAGKDDMQSGGVEFNSIATTASNLSHPTSGPSSAPADSDDDSSEDSYYEKSGITESAPAASPRQPGSSPDSDADTATNLLVPGRSKHRTLTNASQLFWTSQDSSAHGQADASTVTPNANPRAFTRSTSQMSS